MEQLIRYFIIFAYSHLKTSQNMNQQFLKEIEMGLQKCPYQKEDYYTLYI